MFVHVLRQFGGPPLPADQWLPILLLLIRKEVGLKPIPPLELELFAQEHFQILAETKYHNPGPELSKYLKMISFFPHRKKKKKKKSPKKKRKGEQQSL